jgi:hypothetical protein
MDSTALEILAKISEQLAEISAKLSTPVAVAAELVACDRPQIVYTISLGTAQDVMQAQADVFNPEFIKRFTGDFKQIANVRKKADNQTPVAEA